MILALIQQSLIFIVLYYMCTTDRQFDVYDDAYESNGENSETSLAIVDELKWIIPEKYLSGVIIDDRFLVQESLGDGFTGFVRSGIDLKTGEEVAIKFASPKKHYSLEKEFHNYLYLGADDPDIVQIGIPHIIYFGDFGGYKVLVMTRAGSNLHDLTYEIKDRKFTFSTICKIAIQAIRIFEYIHSKGLLFHDVKPSNIAVSRTDANQIFFFDFAFSEFHVNAMGESKAREEANEINGTPEYMARGPLNRYTHVRKDDFISFGLVLLELNGAQLPWMDATNSDDDIYETMDIVLDQWEKYGIDYICDESDHPQFFMEYFNYFDSIQSHDEPDYDFLVELFKNELTDEELATGSLDIIFADNFDDDKPETSLAVVDDFKLFIPEKYIYGVIIDDRYVVGEYLGDGYTGFVRSGIDTKTGIEVAIKFAIEGRSHFLEKEFKNYLYLGADDPNIVQHGIPHIKHYGDFAGYKVLVMTKTGPTLYDLRTRSQGRKLKLQNVCKIAIQAIRILEYIHSKGLVFHDVKPENIVVDATNESQLFFIDFAFSEFYINAMGESKKREIAPYFNGTPVYMARGPLNRYTHVRKDDLISLGILLLELNGAYIPWMYKTNDDDDIEATMDIVLEEWAEYGIERIIDDSENPRLFSQYFDYLDTIESQEKPDYEFLLELFSSHI